MDAEEHSPRTFKGRKNADPSEEGSAYHLANNNLFLFALLFFHIFFLDVFNQIKAGNKGAFDSDFGVLVDIQSDYVTVDIYDLTTDTAAGNDLISSLEIGEGLAVLLGFFLLGTDEQKIENGKHDNQRCKGSDGVTTPCSSTTGLSHGKCHIVKKHLSLLGDEMTLKKKVMITGWFKYLSTTSTGNVP